MIDTLLYQRLLEFAHADVVLVACDFDGTIAELARTPNEATPHSDAVAALRQLAAMPQTHVVVLSGRGSKDLAERLGSLEGVRLIGSHGGEDPRRGPLTLGDSARAALAAVQAAVRTLIPDAAGFLIEEKPTGVAVHYRNAAPSDAAAVLELIRSGPARLPGVHQRHGKMVLELSVVDSDKGASVRALREEVHATATLFCGDDETDEDAFSVLLPHDIGVKIGDGPSQASSRLPTPHDAAQLLASLALMRRDALERPAVVPIEQHTMLSDQRTVALLTPDARLVWCCLPRIDSPALFAELLGGPSAGFFWIRPREGGRSTQRYVGESLIAQTQWENLSVTDCLDCSAGRAFLRAGRTDFIRTIDGRGDVLIEFAPRLDFGRRPTRLRIVDGGLMVEGTLDPIALRAPGVQWSLLQDGPHHRAVASVRLDGGPLVLELRYGISTAQELVVPAHLRVEQTRRFWELWAKPLVLPALHEDLVRRSALVLKGLVYGPTGAIAAAGTTSLPETIGGERNWDYRFCWLRDAALSATALARLGSSGIGTKLLDWLLDVLDREGAPERFRPVYTMTGNHLGAEAEIRELAGYRGSRPVRVGNAAAQQLQLDVYGPIVELMSVLAEGGLALSAEHWRLTEAIVNAVAERWQEPDHGIWEIRGPLRHHVHSKTMCWLAVDRAIAIAQAFTSHAPDQWCAIRDAIAQDVLQHGWKSDIGAFTAAYGEATIDASALHVGLTGLVHCHDPRFRSTVEHIERTLLEDTTVYRYRFNDGLTGEEGGFELCTAWFIESLARMGDVERAEAFLDAYANRFGPTGLAAEEFHPVTREWLGNLPQAYTHIGLINATLACEAARGRR